MCLAQGPQRSGSNPRPLGLESSTLPLSHCAPCLAERMWNMRHYRLLTKKSPVLNTTYSLHMGYTGTMRDINIVELDFYHLIANAQCDFSFKTVSNCVTFLKKRMHFGGRISCFCNRKISAIQTKLNSWLRHETRSFCEGSVMHGPGEEVGVTGGPDSPWKSQVL